MSLNRQKQKPVSVYKVDWIGQDPNFMFSKTFVDGEEAISLAKKNVDSVAYKKTTDKNDTVQWKIIPTDGSKEMIRAVKMKRKLREKKGINQFINADGIGSNTDVTTTEYKQSQRARVVSTVVISGALIYAGTRTEIQNKYVRYGLITLGVLNAIANIRNYRINNNV
jgi:hypothetical protein